MISVIIPYYNNYQHIQTCINSVYLQEFDNFECIIVDDGSDTRSKEELKNIKRKYPQTQIIHKKNSGVSAARNKGIEQAKGEYICFLDADDYWSSKFLSSQYEFLIEGNYDFVYSDYFTFEENQKKTLINKQHFNTPLELLSKNPICTCTILMKKEIVSNIGDFDTTLAYAEDRDLWFRISARGYKIGYNPQAFFFYRKHPDSAMALANKSKYYDNIKALTKAFNLLKGTYTKQLYIPHVIERLQVIRHYAADNRSITQLMHFYWFAFLILGFSNCIKIWNSNPREILFMLSILKSKLLKSKNA